MSLPHPAPATTEKSATGPAPTHEQPSSPPETGAALRALEGRGDRSALYTHFESPLGLTTLDRKQNIFRILRTPASGKSEVTLSNVWRAHPRNWVHDGEEIHLQRRCNRGRRWEEPRWKPAVARAHLKQGRSPQLGPRLGPGEHSSGTTSL